MHVLYKVDDTLIEKEYHNMISYEPFYETLKKRGLSEYALIYKHGILPDMLQRLRHDKVITSKTLDTLCSVLECEVSDILKFVPPDKI